MGIKITPENLSEQMAKVTVILKNLDDPDKIKNVQESMEWANKNIKGAHARYKESIDDIYAAYSDRINKIMGWDD